MKVAFQGIRGAYSEVAAKQLLGRSCRTVPKVSFEEIFDAVQSGSVHRGVIPIENSLAGSIHTNYDLLLSRNVHIVGETYMNIEHVLMAHPDASLRRLKRVRSHPQALAQCGAFFSAHSSITAQPYFDTAGAAKSVIDERDPATGAIASQYAARMYGLKTLKRNLQDRSNNVTRFLIISRKPQIPRNRSRTKCSIAFRPARNRPGILFKILGVFSLRDIDLTKIESRPDPENPFEYLFYLDFDGSPEDERVARALEHLQEVVLRSRLLGAYTRGKEEFRRRVKKPSS
jgi:prephenate dehydratase